MPEASRFETMTHLGLSDHMTAQRKSSNMSTNSDDSQRKISSDSGIGIPCSQGVGPTARLPNNYDELIGEPRLATDLSAAMYLAQQQSLSAAAAALNPAMLGLMSASLGGLFANPLATAMLQQEANTRKLLETTGSGKAGVMNGAKSYNREQQQLPMYPGLAGLIPPPGDQVALSDALRSQLLSRKLSEEVHTANGGVGRPTRKANSFSGISSSPLHKQFSPPTSNTVSPNLNNSHSPNGRYTAGNSGDEQQCSPYRDDDSVESSKSSVRSHTPQPTGLPLDSQSSMSAYGGADVGLSSAPMLNSHQFHPSSRRRKNGIIGSMQMSEMNSYALGPYPPQPAATNDIPMHKLSTASLPASLPSNSQRMSLVHDSLSNRGSPATSRKRQRTQVDEKVGSRREDESYWERRRKNNEAAKRSRDSRRAKEDEIAIRAAFLEQENYKLRLELNKLKEEHSKLQSEMDSRKRSVERKEVDDNLSGSPAAAINQPLEESTTEPVASTTAVTPVLTSAAT